MIMGTNHTDDYSLNFNICTDDNKGLLWIEVKAYETGKPTTTKDFTGNDYGKALAYYNGLQSDLKEKYNK